MTNNHWRELVEIVGVVGIVAAMILIAAQLRESNRIAEAQAGMQLELQLRERFDILNIERMSEPNVAKLFPKLESPDAHLITATEASQIRGIAWHEINNLRSVQRAYAKGLIRRKIRDIYVADFANTLQTWPGIRPHYADIYENLDSIQGAEEFAAIVDYIASQSEIETP